jgi:hypothetical protein
LRSTATSTSGNRPGCARAGSRTSTCTWATATTAPIDGESTNGDAGRGGRKTAILLDEFAAVPNGEEVDAATADTTACRLYQLDAEGAGHPVLKIIRDEARAHPHPALVATPREGCGAYQVMTEKGKAKWTGPWHKLEAARRDPKHMAQEVDMDHGKAGDMFFDADDVERHRRAHQSAPEAIGNIKLDGDYGDEAKRRSSRGATEPCSSPSGGERRPWKFWLPLVNGRPPQDLTYVFGIDVSNGSGGSNSVISVVADEVGMKVAEFARVPVPGRTSRSKPCSRRCGSVARGPAYMVWENNGPGGIFGRKVVKLGWNHFYFQRQDGVRAENKTPRWGWHSNQQRKEILLARYREALGKDHIINPCEESLNEVLDYVYDENGLLMPGKFKQDTNGARALHGDRVIADALTILGRDELPKTRNLESRPPAGSFAARKKDNDQKKARERRRMEGVERCETYDNKNRGAMFKNDRKGDGDDKKPNYTGKVEIERAMLIDLLKKTQGTNVNIVLFVSGLGQAESATASARARRCFPGRPAAQGEAGGREAARRRHPVLTRSVGHER